MGKYMTKDGAANLDSIEYVMRSIGRMEDAIFKKRREDECQRRIRQARNNQRNRNNRNMGGGHRNGKSCKVRHGFRDGLWEHFWE